MCWRSKKSGNAHWMLFVLLRVATNALFMVFPVVHDVCYVKGRYFATFLS